MKKMFPVALVVAITLMFTSCRKDYDCTCTYTDSSGATQTIPVSIHGTKAEAKSACSPSGGSLASYSGFDDLSCHLK